MIKIKYIEVLFGDRFINKILKLLNKEKNILDIHNIKVIFKVKEIWLEIEYIYGNKFIMLINKIIIKITLNKKIIDLFLFSIIKIFFSKFIFLL